MPDAKTQPRTFLERDDWLRAVIASDLPHVAIRVAVAIGLHLHVKSGRCDPGYDALAAGLRMSRRSIFRLVAMLRRVTGPRGRWFDPLRRSAPPNP
jgi:hypothetical protein